MRKALLLLTAVLLSVTGSTAQQLAKSPLRHQVSAPAQAAESNSVWWGYTQADASVSGLGVNSADTYHCAIFIPGDHAIAGGKAIKSIRFYVLATNVKDIKAWVSTNKPTTLNETTTERLVDVTDDMIESKTGLATVQLDEAYNIPSTGAYVGYSFTVTKVSTTNDAYPIAITADSDAPNTLIIRTNTAVPSWQDMNGQGFGRLYLQVLLNGEFADNVATAEDFGNVYAQAGKEVTTNLKVTNGGSTAISSLDYTITTDGTASAEQHVTLQSPIAFNTTGNALITLKADDVKSIKQKTVTITKVNGQPNNAANPTAQGTLYTLEKFIERNLVVEEFTGTGCPWCPRGIVGMEKMRKNLGDRFIGIAVHQFNSSDAMYISASSYARLSFSGAPSCMIDRKGELDPYYGMAYDILDDCNAELAIPALADVTVSGRWNEDSTKVDATAFVDPLFSETYKIEFVLIADSLSGTGSGWNQGNNYAQYNASQLPADLAVFANGGKYGKSTVTGLVFNDVAIASSYVNSKNGAVLNADNTSSYTLSLPTKATLKNALKKNNIYVAALLIGSDGTVVNAAKASISAYGSANGIETVSTQRQTTSSQARYSLDGRRLSAPQRGLNIVRMADGTTRKVIVK